MTIHTLEILKVVHNRKFMDFDSLLFNNNLIKCFRIFLKWLHLIIKNCFLLKMFILDKNVYSFVYSLKTYSKIKILDKTNRLLFPKVVH